MVALDRCVGIALLCLMGASAAILCVEREDQLRRKPPREDFQRLVGGLGFGPALDLSVCAFGFDPRLQGTCSAEHGCIPGGSCFCPLHSGSILHYRSPLKLVRKKVER